MIYLIDTHILIWLFGKSNNLPKNIFELLKNKKNKIYVSAVSIWEIAIKVSIGKLKFPFEITNIINEIGILNISILDITSEHLINVAALPFHHKDPFDRLIISQSIIENIPIISSDNIFSKYDIEIIW
jgi:PIN domain nuclease of toxin-antitoxin system